MRLSSLLTCRIWILQYLTQRKQSPLANQIKSGRASCPVPSATKGPCCIRQMPFHKERTALTNQPNFQSLPQYSFRVCKKADLKRLSSKCEQRVLVRNDIYIYVYYRLTNPFHLERQVRQDFMYSKYSQETPTCHLKDFSISNEVVAPASVDIGTQFFSFQLSPDMFASGLPELGFSSRVKE